MLVVNDNGEAHLIKKANYDTSEVYDDVSSDAESSSSAAPSLTSTISEKIIKHLNLKSRGKNDRE